MYWVDNDVTESERLVDEAIEIAREIDSPGTLAAALQRKIFIPAGPDAPRIRLAIADEMVELGESSGDREAVVRGHAYRLWSLLELGDVPAVDRELELYARLADELRMPEHTWHTFALRGMRALLDGDMEEAERLAQEARRAGDRAEQALAQQYYGIQMIQIRSMQGRAGELLPAVRDLAERFPGIPAWRDGAGHPRGQVRRRRAGPAGARPLRRRRLRRAPQGRQLVRRDEPARGGDRDDRRHRRTPSASTSCSSPTRGWRSSWRGPRRATAPSTASSACSRRRWTASTTPSGTSATRVEIATRMGDRPGMALCGLALAELLLERDRDDDRELAHGAARHGARHGA